MKITVKLSREENLSYFGMSVIDIDIEEYLNGVVPAEIGNADLEAGKAQAIAARTFAYNKYLKQGYITDQSAKDQAFRASRFSNSYANAHRAVAETKGQVLFYNGALITNANYSHANGGRTYSCKEKWGSDKPYLIARNDPWDYAYSKGKKNGHGVGLSQSGAKYASSIGINYQEILQFYYPGTTIELNYGEKQVQKECEKVMELTNLSLVEFAKQMVGQPYWYGTHGQKCSKSLLERKTNQYPDHYGSSRMSTYNSHIAKKYVCTDCIGLIKSFMWTNGGNAILSAIGTDSSVSQSYGSNNFPDKSANGMFTYAKSKGLSWDVISSIPEIPGLAVRFDKHVGIYIGNGKVIEARGFNYGVVETELSKGKWTHWYAIPGLKYTYSIEAIPPTATKAIVNINSGSLNIRKSQSTGAPVIAHIPAKTEVLVQEKGDEWCYIYYNGTYGYVLTEYLLFDNGNLDFGERLPLSKGMSGDDVKELQDILIELGYNLKYGSDGKFGSETEKMVKKFQQDHDLTADGIVGKYTYTCLIQNQGEDAPEDSAFESYDFSNYPTIKRKASSTYVSCLQDALTKLGYELGTIDGIFGSKTDSAVRKFQKAMKLKVDGICGQNTWSALAKELNKLVAQS